jgi:Protein kinase domain
LREVAGVEKTGNTALTIAGQMLGTPYYMSPEQWGELPEDGSSEIDGRADLYSLGVLFYEIIAGKRPFGGVTILELRKQHVSEIPKPLHEIAPGVTEAFSKAIARAVAKDRSDRQSTAAELEAELTGALSADGAPSLGATEVGSLPERPSSLATSAERPSPTMGDSGAVTMVEGPAQTPPAFAESQAATIPTLVVTPQEAAERAPSAPQSMPQVSARQQMDVAIPSRRSPLMIGGIVIALLILIGVGAYAAVLLLNRKTAVAPATSTTTAADPTAPMHEVARYWLEVEGAGQNDNVRAGDPIELASGQRFKFHFSPNENGYIYLLGPGENEAPAIFLSAQPSSGSGLKTNEVRSALDFSFPADTGQKENFLRLNNTAGTDEFTFVFSPVPITNPAFFAGPSEHHLTPEELKAWADFQAQSRANASTTEVIKAGATPKVAVKMPQNAPENASVIFRVRIQHR